jgi:nucleotide-binding universal stress UspA family protein
MKTILGAIDFSPVTKQVIAEAASLARAAQARLILLNVTSPQSLFADYAALEAVLQGAEPQEPGTLHATAIHGDSLQIIGEPIDVILEQAARYSADCIVMGSHGHTALFELMFGGTCAGVIRGTRCPIIVIPARTRKGEKWHREGFRRKDPVPGWSEHGAKCRRKF